MFTSILYPHDEEQGKEQQNQEPQCFHDLNLDKIFYPILKAKKEFELERFFYTPAHNTSIIQYRQDVMQDLENKTVRLLFEEFSTKAYAISHYMENTRELLSAKEHWDNNYLTRGRMLDYADRYCQAVTTLSEGAKAIQFKAQGLSDFSAYLKEYCARPSFQSLCMGVKRLREDFSQINYCMLIKDGTIRVRKYENQSDYTAEILRNFEKFRQGEVKDYRHKLSEEPSADHVEVAVLDMLAKVYPDVFRSLEDFCSEYLHFDDPVILRFSNEIQFYLSWLDMIEPLQREGLPFCYPTLCPMADHLYARDCFNLALAIREHSNTVTNDFSLDTPERFLVITGPNQGGKTTFARAFGQIHYLASLGLCVPGTQAALYYFDNILTHFGREENIDTLNGKLQDDLVRLHDLLEKATPRSIIIVNEIFASTTLADALLLGGKMMDAFAALGAPGVIVTFLDELASHGPETVSMMSTVNDKDQNSRTFKIVRKPADGLAYALQIAQRHGLTYEQLCGRLAK
ncbi:MutS-related protein [Acetanaerobacterium elongatum]|uniref:MutS domain V n=1 Tax=Acetanaerobacterium elongatum TaxID=258515 RepID=A0A1H0C0W6_9FIRM|nr:hypothetical protein [Acetanaerobacterium elongatum]SDN51497.1 MutS domain V [Acetanaerobacterium elongatum]